MDLFEYQGKQYFARYDIPVSPGGPADKSGAVSDRCELSAALPRKRTSRIPRVCEGYGRFSTPTGSRTPVFGLRTRRPGPLDDGGGHGGPALRPPCSSNVGPGVKKT